MKKLSYLLLLALISFASCSKDKDGDDNSQTSEITEARLELDISFSNPVVNKFFSYIKTGNSLPWQAYYDSWDNLTSEEDNQLSSLFSNNPTIAGYLVRLPIVKNEIFIKGAQVRGVSRGIAHEIQNLWNNDAIKGNYYVGSLMNDNSLGFSYEQNILGETGLSVSVDPDDFTRTETNESITIEGITAKKITYTVKTAVQDFYEIKKIDVYVASSLDKSINLMHPFITNEAAGVIKIEVEMIKTDFGKIVYELKKVEKRAVSAQELINSTPAETLNPQTPEEFETLYLEIRSITSFFV
ncbi:hypothetical protein [Gynurincola endophyticus]|uniref:hypothetical protein n=1 Tax=Gynurincola endophyticus TaxID=2479004 RepID=UPI000F8EDBA4|nr:hypothetical protein [Gynurincola endophyticus]